MLGTIWDAGLASPAAVFRFLHRRLSRRYESETRLEFEHGETSTLLAGLVLFPGVVLLHDDRSRSIMKRIKTTGVVLLALFAFSAIAATAAQAEVEAGPYWSIEGTRLEAGKTFEIVAKSTSAAQTLSATTGQVISCPAVKLKPGSVLLGSNGNEPGKSNETLEYGPGCTVSGNGSPCKPTGGAIKTEPLTNELVYDNTNKKSLVVEFTPVKGKILSKITFEGTGCTLPNTTVTGQVVAKVLTDAEPPVLLELPNHVAQAESFLLEAPGTGHVIRHIWLVAGGAGKEVETEELNSFGAESVYTGTALIQLAVHGTAVTTKWSPLL